MVEAEWGSCHKDKRSNKGHHATWRPHQNTTACQKWSQFQFFISRIETSISTGFMAQLGQSNGSITDGPAVCDRHPSTAGQRTQPSCQEFGLGNDWAETLK
ncbi:uncharacterized protein LACBIDRAFT_309663 [Laccaria bicolor S238N-H82]|uniref:Predicted protein n=1 Tax=Laccaria bicolor (strain S238N-H82 / ATCC MYA-4686) TaxID=486041 RepID=B0DSS7_LACBS|nr:uncharacterized protein LACBIDRAFT_309663 [Laccaria bicolor S238N-H82]EDR02294.1 predicted protein [Laccaria bicolor S238N-H82]|eukprot:XP_001886971.1 predicted protein [Laccaria bicolor S238N-H82]